jgi:hypothetical protein
MIIIILDLFNFMYIDVIKLSKKSKKRKIEILYKQIKF